jgi:hypothetical protein
MIRKIKPIVRRNIVVWPLIPRLTRGVNLSRQIGAIPSANVVVLPVIQIRPRQNDIQKIIERTARNQRPHKRNLYALEKLRRMFDYPA